MDTSPVTITLGNIDLGHSTYSMSGGTPYYDTITLGPMVSADFGSITISDSDALAGFGSYWEEQEIVNEYREEKAIRERNEGVQKAWEQYKIMVTLAKNPPENLDES